MSFGHFNRKIPSFAQNCGDRLQIFLPIVPGFRGKNAEIDVLQVMKNCAAAAFPSSQLNSVCLQIIQIRLQPRILVPPNYDRGFVAPNQ